MPGLAFAEPRPSAAILPRLVIFDVDGTLQDSVQWWPRLCAEGVAAFARVHGLVLPVPDHELAYSVIGKPDSGVWATLLPPEERHRWRELREFLVPLEVEILSGGVDYMFPGTGDLLAWLRRHGVRIALASNCRSTYFAAMLEGQGLGALVDDAYCLDSEGVRTKVDMLRLALAAARTRDAVMVGDRDSDLEAARQNGVPFVHRLGFHGAGELPAEGHAASSAELADLLLAASGFWQELSADLAGAGRIGVTGAPGTGKSLFAARLARVLGRPLLDQDDFLRVPPGREGADHLARAVELPRFAAALAASPPDCVVAGLFLGDARLRPALDRVLALEAPRDEIAARLAARDGDASAERLRASWWPAWQEHAAQVLAPGRTLWVDHRCVLRPRRSEGPQA